MCKYLFGMEISFFILNFFFFFNCLRYQVRHFYDISRQEITLPKFYGVHVVDIDVLHLPPPLPYKGKDWEVYIYVAWTSFLLMVKRSPRLSWGALNARAPYGHIDFWGHDSVGQRHLLLSFNRANSKQIYWPAVAWQLLGWNTFLNVSFTLYFKPLLPVKADWFVNSMKFKSWPEATYLSWSLPR